MLGRTGLRVSAIGFGTVSLGIDYGIAAPGEFGRPADKESIALLENAAEAGVNFYDTAPAYGESERLLGEALDGNAVIATKVTVGDDVAASLLRSRSRLKKVPEIVQIHNATVDLLRDGKLLSQMEAARHRGELRWIGASVYTEAEALTAIECGRVDVLQVAYNLLDQRMAARVFPAAQAAGVGVLVRSAFLKGALTEKAAHLPDSLRELREAADRARATLGVDWQGLPQMALRFCLSHPAIATVLFGARTRPELDAAVAAAQAGPLSPEMLQKCSSLALDDDRLLNPAKW